MRAFPDKNRFGAMQVATHVAVDTAAGAVGRVLRDSASAAQDMRVSAWRRSTAARLANTRTSVTTPATADADRSTEPRSAEPVTVTAAR